MHDQRYAYYAFISYSRKDEKWAKWLQRKLEGYRLPSAIRRESDGRIPKHIRPIFRDKTDLGVGQRVRQNLRQELADSRFLIVVCSPESAKSDFVNMEIRNFQEMGRADRIIPFIVSGTPEPKNPGEEQCYPPALLQDKDTMLGASLRELSPNQALVKIVAAILGLKFDHLWQRHKRHQRLWSTGYAVAACLLLVLGYGVVDYFFIHHVRYYDDYVERWGVPEGIGRLSSEQVAHRSSSWRLEVLRGKLRRLVRVDSRGNVQAALNSDEQERSDDQRYYYAEDGRLNLVDEYSYTGQFVQRREFTQDLEDVQFRHQKGLAGKNLGHMTARQKQDGGLSFETKKSEIAAFHYQYDASGLIVQERYANALGASRADANGVFGQQFTYTPEGRLESIAYLDSDGKPFQIRGVSGKRFSYANSGFRSKIAWVDAHDTPAFNPDRIAWAAFVVDAWGNRVREAYFSPDGQPCFHRDGYALMEKEYDAGGNMIQVSYHGLDGKPCFAASGIAVSKSIYDDKGRQIRVASFDMNGKPCLNKQGFSAVEKAYDERGNLVLESYFTTDGKPCFTNGGYASAGSAYDEHGNVIRLSYFDTNDKPCVVSHGFSTVINTFDGFGNKIRSAYFDVNGRPCLNKFGFSIIEIMYDERGNVVKESYFGLDGQPCRIADGIAASVTHYDVNGNEIRQEYYGVDGRPCLRSGACAVLLSTHDAHGNMLSEAYLDVDGNPHDRGDNVALLRHEYDHSGNIIRESYFGVDGQPCLRLHEFAALKCEYDPRGNEIKRSYVGLDGRLCQTRAGYAVIRMDFDVRGNLVKASYFGVDGRPCLSNGVYASRAMTYDARGNLIKEAYFGLDGKPCLNQEGIAGWKDQYDARGNKISRTTFGLEGKPAAGGVQMVRIGAVASQSPAAGQGVKSNDILFEYCYWHWVDDKELQHLQEAITRCKTFAKHILTLSQDGQIHAFDAPVGTVGMDLQYVKLTNEQAAALQFSYILSTKFGGNQNRAAPQRAQ
jgi:hypothetical protein